MLPRKRILTKAEKLIRQKKWLEVRIAESEKILKDYEERKGQYPWIYEEPGYSERMESLAIRLQSKRNQLNEINKQLTILQ